MTTRQELLSQLSEAEDNLRHAKRHLSDAKKHWTECETEVISCKFKRDTLKENLRIYDNITCAPEIEQRDQEIAQFQADYPELCAMAKQRDLDKAKGD